MEIVKEAVGWVAWELGRRSDRVRRRLSPVGLRTKQGWYSDRVGAVEMCGGGRVLLSRFDESYLSFELFWKGWTYYEPYTALLLRQLLDGASRFVDVGANIGYFTLTAATCQPGLDIVAFEPNPKRARVLEGNLRRNRLEVRLERVAISDREGTARFFLPRSDMSGTLEPDFNAHVEDIIEVPTTTLDAVLGGGSRRSRTVIKIDAEGHEPAILRGATELLAQEGPDLLLEVTEDYDSTTERSLRDAGYAFYTITHRGLVRTERMTVAREGDLLFLNTLVTRRPADEIARLSARLLPDFRAIDPVQTCHNRPVR
jgi:FkbM family methyltransferase